MDDKQFGEFRTEQAMRLSKAKVRLFHVIEEELLNPPEAVMLFEICKHELQHSALYQEKKKEEGQTELKIKPEAKPEPKPAEGKP